MLDVNVKQEFENIADLYNNLYNQVNENYSEYKVAVDEYNLKEQDILHYIELEKFDAVKGAKLLKLLKKILIERRVAKNKLHYYQSFRTRLKDSNIDIKDALRDYEEPESYTYKTNILTAFDKFENVQYYSTVKKEWDIPIEYLTIKQAVEKIRLKYKLKIHLIDSNIKSLIKSNELKAKFINNTYYVYFNSLVEYLQKQDYILEEK